MKKLWIILINLKRVNQSLVDMHHLATLFDNFRIAKISLALKVGRCNSISTLRIFTCYFNKIIFNAKNFRYITEGFRCCLREWVKNEFYKSE